MLGRVQPIMGSQGPNASLHAGIVNPQQEKAKSKHGFDTRKRGRKAEEVPSSKHLEIMNATRTQTYAEVGAKHQISRQRVGQIIRRWKKYVPVRSLRVQEIVPRVGMVQIPRRENRIHVVSFRLTATEVQLLQSRYPDMKSVDRAARGIVTKFLSI